MEQLPLPVAQAGECETCGCVAGDGLPPSVGECSCGCHDSSRLYAGYVPWSSEEEQ